MCLHVLVLHGPIERTLYCCELWQPAREYIAPAQGGGPQYPSYGESQTPYAVSRPFIFSDRCPFRQGFSLSPLFRFSYTKHMLHTALTIQDAGIRQKMCALLLGFHADIDAEDKVPMSFSEWTLAQCCVRSIYIYIYVCVCVCVCVCSCGCGCCCRACSWTHLLSFGFIFSTKRAYLSCTQLFLRTLQKKLLCSWKRVRALPRLQR